MMNEFLDVNPRFHEIASINAEPSNWFHEQPDTWELADSGWQRFATRWCKWRKEDNQIFHQKPLVLDLDNPDLEKCPTLIRNCYLKAEKVVWQEAADRRGSGVIVTGQPGIGKSLFLWYLLARLLMANQPVLLHLDLDTSLFFWKKQVYAGPPRSVKLPTPLNDSAFIWSLSDIKVHAEPPGIATHSRCFPVQTPSPSESRYKIWEKVRGPCLTALPLWTRKELEIAVRRDPNFPVFWSYLDKYWERFLHHQKVSETSCYSEAVSLLRKTSQEDAPTSIEGAFKILFDAMISRFGPIPRDVLFGLYMFDSHTEDHDRAINVSLQKLQDNVQNIISQRQSPDTTSSHRVVSINPTGKIGKKQIWKIDFKSTHIMEQLSARYIEKSENEVRSFIHRFSSVPKWSGVIGGLFRALVHRDITRGTGSWSFWKMDSRRIKGSIKFVYKDPAAEAEGFPVFPRQQVKFPDDKLPEELANDQYYVPCNRNFALIDSFIVKLDFGAGSAQLWLLKMTTSEEHAGSKKGYVKIRKIVGTIRKLLRKHTSDHPPRKKLKGQRSESMDSESELTELEDEPMESEDELVESEGEPMDSDTELTESVDELVESEGEPMESDGKPLVKVHYILVSPYYNGAQPGRAWSLPKDWDKGTTRCDHRGDGYLMQFRLSPS